MKTKTLTSNSAYSFILCLILLVSSLTFVGCKKGKEDPLFTLRSRKARLTGKWVLTEAVYYKNGQKLNIDKNNELVENGEVSYSAWDIYIEKDGSMIELIHTSNERNTWNFSRTGTWTFLDKHDGYKDKEVVQFEYTRQEESGIDQNGFYATDVNLTRTQHKSKVIGLHNNKLHMQFEKCDLYDSADLTFERERTGFHPMGVIYLFLLTISPRSN